MPYAAELLSPAGPSNRSTRECDATAHTAGKLPYTTARSANRPYDVSDTVHSVRGTHQCHIGTVWTCPVEWKDITNT